MKQKSRRVISYSSRGPSPSQMMQSESGYKVTELIPLCGVRGITYRLTTDTSRSGDGCIYKSKVHQLLGPHSPEVEQGSSCFCAFFLVASVRVLWAPVKF